MGHWRKGIIQIQMVVDIVDTERYELVKEEICHLLSADELASVPLLVMANKIDIDPKLAS